MLSIAENRYSGIPTIRKAFKDAGLPEPIFTVRRGEFIVIFKNNFESVYISKGKGDINESLLQFCKKPRSREEIVAFTGFSQYYSMSKLIKPLIDAGKIYMTIPEKPRSRNQRFVSVER
jgi:ATP-dependent DNA helicase RecG